METREASDDASSEPTINIPSSSLPTPPIRPSFSRSPASNPGFASLPPLMTSSPSQSSAAARRIPSYGHTHLSSFSTSSARDSLSRPQSTVFPFFLSSLSFALVRDFAYPTYNQLHYGPPPPDQHSGWSTPASEIGRRVSDPHGMLRASAFKGLRSQDQGSGDGSYFGMPGRPFPDGPPYAEDADLLSPIVTSTKHKKTKSNVTDYGLNSDWQRRDTYPTTSFEPEDPTGQHGFPAGQALATLMGDDQMIIPPSDQQSAWRRRPREESQSFDPNIAPELQISSVSDDYSPSDPPSDGLDDTDGSRLSRAYQFTIASPDEEFHGKAVALFDFARENDNELPFIEGQVLWVSYRHGEGWLVAQDPKSGESGLIPEEYVRLLRDIEGGLSGLKGDDFTEEDADLDTPVELRKPAIYDRPMSGASGLGVTNGEHYPPVLSHFTTSSKDLEPYMLSHAQQQHTQQPQRGSFLDSQETTPTTTLQPRFDPTQPDQKMYAPHAQDEADGKGVLLSPETFKPKDAVTAKSSQNPDATLQMPDEARLQHLPNGDTPLDTEAIPPQPLTVVESGS